MSPELSLELTAAILDTLLYFFQQNLKSGLNDCVDDVFTLLSTLSFHALFQDRAQVESFMKIYCASIQVLQIDHNIDYLTQVIAARLNIIKKAHQEFISWFQTKYLFTLTLQLVSAIYHSNQEIESLLSTRLLLCMIEHLPAQALGYEDMQAILKLVLEMHESQKAQPLKFMMMQVVAIAMWYDVQSV